MADTKASPRFRRNDAVRPDRVGKGAGPAARKERPSSIGLRGNWEAQEKSTRCGADGGGSRGSLSLLIGGLDGKDFIGSCARNS
jgi:hypothetical protein